MIKFLEVGRTKGRELVDDTMSFLVKKYNQSKEVFTYASPFGQILLVMHNLQQIVLFYIQDSITQLNYKTANRKHTIYGNARMSGHDPMRGSSSIGEIALKINLDGISKISGNEVYITNYSRIHSDINGLDYIVYMNSDYQKISLKDNIPNFIIREGKMEFQKFTGNGLDIQSFNVNVPQSSMIDYQKVIVSVNDTNIEQYDSILEIPYGKMGCIVKTSYSNGIDIFFGDKISNKIPEIGDEIRIDYLIHNGSYGNSNELDYSLKFIDAGLDMLGNEINLNDIFKIEVIKNMDFGADSENPEKTKMLSSSYPKNNVIHDTGSIEYYFNKMNIFDFVKCIKNNKYSNRFDTILYPDITKKLRQSEDYFTIDISKLKLSDIQKTRLLNGINNSGRLSTNIDLRIIDPIHKKFICYVMVDVFNETDGISNREVDVTNVIRKTISDYMITNKRKNVIPHSDIVRILDEIKMIDKVKVMFKGESTDMIDGMGNISLPESGLATLRGNITIDGILYEDRFEDIVNLQINFI